MHALERLQRALGVWRRLEPAALLAQRVNHGLEPARVLGVIRAGVVLEKDGIGEDRHVAHEASVPHVWATIRR